MDKIYKLLRNNQQTGPYTFEELVQTGLKPFDLIWADGRTAGWMYPSEIEGLKPFVAGALQAAPTEAATAEDMPVATPVGMSAAADQPSAARQPAATIPATATHIFISLPAGAAGARMAAPAQKVVAPPSLEEESPEQKLERKALELRQKVQAFAAQKSEQEAEPTLDTKYTRSLDDIKEEYSLWMHQQKHGRRRVRLPRKQLVVAAGVLLAVGVGYTALKQWMGTAEPGVQPTLGQAPVVPLKSSAPAVAAQRETEQPSVVNTGVRNRHSHALDELEQANKLIEEDLKRFEGSANATVTKPSKEPIQQDTPDIHGQEEETYAAVVYQTGTNQTSRSAEPTSGTDDQHTEKTVPLGQQIDVKARYLKTPRGKGIEGLELVLRNNSRQSLKTVAIDVFYYKEGESLLAKETVYFNDVLPGETLTLTAPGHKKAATATYQLGLISTGAGLYVAKQ